MRRIIDICWRLCKQVPLLPITILAAIPLALLGSGGRGARLRGFLTICMLALVG